MLVLAEVAGPVTGRAEDADPAKRAAVRLTHVVAVGRPVGRALRRPADERVGRRHRDRLGRGRRAAVPALHLGRGAPRTSSSARRGATSCSPTTGARSRASTLGAVPESTLALVAARRLRPVRATSRREPVPVRFRPTLANAPVTQALPAPTTAIAQGPATAPLARRPRRADASRPPLHDFLEERGFDVPRRARGRARRRRRLVGLRRRHASRCCGSTAGTLHRVRAAAAAAATLARRPARGPAGRRSSKGRCSARPSRGRRRPTCSASDGDAPEFVVEVENDGAATLRFGDGVHGRRPETGTAFEATYRVGNGVAGNVGAGAIAHVATLNGGVLGADNPLAAAGGTDPEAADAVRRDAPEAYLVQQRAVTADDYASVSERNPHVQRAAATFRWTGSWHTVFVTADRAGGLAVDDAVRDRTAARTSSRSAWPATTSRSTARASCRSTSALHVCVQPEYFRAHVTAAVLDVLSSGVRADGTLGFFHPDRFTFGQPVYLSAIVAAAQAVPGVQSVIAEDVPAPARRRVERRSTPACCRWAGSRSRGSTTTRASPSTACSSLTAGGGK